MSTSVVGTLACCARLRGTFAAFVGLAFAGASATSSRDGPGGAW
jgi:hypothetical protein